MPARAGIWGIPGRLLSLGGVFSSKHIPAVYPANPGNVGFPGSCCGVLVWGVFWDQWKMTPRGWGRFVSAQSAPRSSLEMRIRFSQMFWWLGQAQGLVQDRDFTSQETSGRGFFPHLGGMLSEGSGKGLQFLLQRGAESRGHTEHSPKEGCASPR